jgi:hypothetical protein
VQVILRLNVSLHQTLYLKTATANVREKLGTMVSIVETDLRVAGYGVAGTAFLTADSNSVQFLGDLGDDGVMDTLRYYLSANSVYRALNSTQPTCVGVGVTRFKFDYFDLSAAPAATLDAIRSIKLTVAMEENYDIKQTSDGKSYRPSVHSEYQFYPQNL